MRNSKGFTTVETLVAFALAVIVFGIIWAVYSPTQRQGALVEARLSTIRAVMILSARLEQDAQAARAIQVEDGALLLKSATRTVRYAHDAGAYVQRTAGDRPRTVGGCRFAKVAFEPVAGEPGAVRVTVEPLVSRRGRVAEEPASFVVRLPVRASASWQSAMAAD